MKRSIAWSIIWSYCCEGPLLEHPHPNPTSKLFTGLVPCWLPASLLSQNTNNLPQSPQIISQNDGQGGPPLKLTCTLPQGHSLAPDPQQDTCKNLTAHFPKSGSPPVQPLFPCYPQQWPEDQQSLGVPPVLSTLPAPPTLPTTARRKIPHHLGTNATIYKHGAVWVQN